MLHSVMTHADVRKESNGENVVKDKEDVENNGGVLERRRVRVNDGLNFYPSIANARQIG